MKALAVSISRRSLTLIVCETVLIVAAVCVGATIRLGGDAWDLLFVNGDIKKALLIALVCQVSLSYADLYRAPCRCRSARAVHRGRAGAQRHLVLAGRPVLLVPVARHWPRGLRRVVFPGPPGGGGWRLVFEWLTRRVAPRERSNT